MVTKVREINLSDIKKSRYPLVIGYFGCVHVMHGQLFHKQWPYNILTFADFSKKKKSQLYPLDERIEMLKAFKPANIFIYDISKHNLTAQQFIDQILLNIKPDKIIVGTDFHFGSDHKPYNELQRFFPVETINHNARVSTTIICQMLMKGEVERANSLMFNPYHYASKWISGEERGRKLRMRTINLLINRPIFLAEGVYISRIKIGLKWFKAITFYGKSKTYKSKEATLETHVYNKIIPPRFLYPGSVRDNIQVEFLKFIRTNKKFKNPQQLVKAFNDDIKIAKHYFERHK